MSIRELKNKNGSVFEVRFKYKDKYGINRYYSKRGFKSPREANKHEQYIREKIRQNSLINENLTLNEVFDEYMINDNTLAITTKQKRRLYYNKHIRNSIGEARINLIDFRAIQNIFTNLEHINKQKTNKNILAMLKGVFDYAYNCEYIDRLPYARIRVKGLPSVCKKHVISDSDFKELINYTLNKNTLRNKSLSIAFYIAYYTGMRRGEILALNKSDFDFDNNTINVHSNLYKDNDSKQLCIKNTKTETSNAIIPLPIQLKNILVPWFNENPSNIVIVDNDLNYISLSLVENFLTKYSKEHKKIGFHMFRHTYTTKLYESGIDAKTAQKLLRHKDFNTTMTTYTHIKESDLNSVIDKVFN